MRFGKNGFDTKNPMELVTRTTLGYHTPNIAGGIALMFAGFIFLRVVPFLVGFAYLLVFPLGYIFIALVLNPRELFLKHNREKKADEPSVVIGHIKNGAWGEYSFPSKITINWPLQEEELETSYCKTIIGIDHEYLHHILYFLEGKPASAGFDNLAGNLTDHCRWVGLNLTIEGDMRGFWNNVERTVMMR